MNTRNTIKVLTVSLSVVIGGMLASPSFAIGGLGGGNGGLPVVGGLTGGGNGLPIVGGLVGGGGGGIPIVGGLVNGLPIVGGLTNHLPVVSQNHGGIGGIGGIGGVLRHRR